MTEFFAFEELSRYATVRSRELKEIDCGLLTALSARLPTNCYPKTSRLSLKM